MGNSSVDFREPACASPRLPGHRSVRDPWRRRRSAHPASPEALGRERRGRAGSAYLRRGPACALPAAGRSSEPGSGLGVCGAAPHSHLRVPARRAGRRRIYRGRRCQEARRPAAGTGRAGRTGGSWLPPGAPFGAEGAHAWGCRAGVRQPWPLPRP